VKANGGQHQDLLEQQVMRSRLRSLFIITHEVLLRGSKSRTPRSARSQLRFPDLLPACPRCRFCTWDLGFRYVGPHTRHRQPAAAKLQL